MSNKLEEHMTLISQLYPGAFTTVAQQGEPKPRRRRKKNKGESDAKGSKKRKLSADQVNLLELNFGNEHKLESERKDKLASELGLDPRQVAVWFQNKRARLKTKKLEEEFNKLKASHDGTVVEKCQLESEVLRLKEQLSQAEKEIRRLSERNEGVSSNSSSSSLSMEVIDPPFLGEFGIDSYDDVFYTPQCNYMHGLEWISLYM